MADSSRDVVVVGAGVIGTTIAYHLAEAGLSVVVLDDHPIGSGCTFHGTGQVWPLIWNETPHYRLGLEGRSLVLDLAQEMKELTGIETGVYTSDTVVPFFNDEDRVRLERDLETSEHEVEVRWLDRSQVLEMEPRINPEVVEGAFLPDGAQVDAYALTQAIATVAAKRGVEFRRLRAVGVDKQGGRVQAVRHTAGRIPCGAAVIAMGAWSAAASDWVDFPIPVKPLKGETLRMRPDRGFPISVWRPSGGTAFQRKDGTISIGATGTNRFADLKESIVRLADDQEPTEEGANDVIRKAVYVIPELEQAEVVYHLAGPRPLSADAMPIIGAVPSLAGAFVATGHRNKGLHLSAITARVIRDLVTGSAPSTKSDLTRFLPERFTDREVEFDVAGVTRRPA